MKLEVKFTEKMNEGNINYWDLLNGEDIIFEIIDDKIYLDEKNITMEEFLNRLREAKKLKDEFFHKLEINRLNHPK